MDSLRVFIKNLLKGFSGRSEGTFESPCIRITDLKDISRISESTDSPTAKLPSTDEINNSQMEETHSVQLHNVHTNIISQCDKNDQLLQKMNNLTKPEPEYDENDNRLTKLSLVIPSMDEIGIVDDVSKVQSPLSARNSNQFIFTPEKHFCTDKVLNKTTSDVITPSKQKQIRPIMGKNALLKRANIDPSDSLIIHEIVLDKYNPVMNHFVNRMYQRRISRNSVSEDESNYNETIFSSPPNYSPISMSSVGSAPYDEKTGFVFPTVLEKDIQMPVTSTGKRKSHSFLGRRLSMKKAFSFLHSTDDVNAETPFENTQNSSLISSGTGMADTSFSDFDPEKFLKNALGGGSCFSESGIYNSTKEKNLDSISHRRNSSIDTTDISSLLSKATSLYSSLKKNIQKHRPRLKSNLCDYHSKNQSQSTENSQLEGLKRELAIQNEIIFQISKALIYCRGSKEFNNSTEHIEAEKILLGALITKESLINEINTIEFNNYQNSNDPRSSGQIEISNISFLPNDNHSNTTNENHSCKTYFLVVITCGKNVLASSVLEQDEKGCLNVNKSFQFKDLSADFEICVCVYSMTIKNKDHMNQDHHMKCPSPKTIFHLNKASRKYRLQTDVPYIKPSAFSLQGKCYIRNPELPKNNTEPLILKLHDVPVYSSISPTFSVNVTSLIRLEVRTVGFLTIGVEQENTCTLWNRRWCVLESTLLKYWNYPSEETSTPLGCIDLHYCMVQKISAADRSTCARPKTLMLPIQHGDSFKKYLLSADSTGDMELWENELNFVVKTLLMWNCMRC